MNLLVVFHLLHAFHNSVSSFTSPPKTEAEVCTIQNSFQSDFVSKGDFTIGGIFPLHYNQEMPDLNSTYRPPPVKCSGWVSFNVIWNINCLKKLKYILCFYYSLQNKSIIQWYLSQIIKPLEFKVKKSQLWLQWNYNVNLWLEPPMWVSQCAI